MKDNLAGPVAIGKDYNLSCTVIKVEIYLPIGTAIERTNEVADSLEVILAKNKRVVSIANFPGCSSARFQTTYAP